MNFFLMERFINAIKNGKLVQTKYELDPNKRSK